MNVKKDIFNIAAAAGAGGYLGATAINMSGMTAAGMVGRGVGIGAAAGPVGIVVGALAGVTAFSVVRTTQDAQRDPEIRQAVKSARQKVGRWIGGGGESTEETA